MKAILLAFLASPVFALDITPSGNIETNLNITGTSTLCIKAGSDGLTLTGDCSNKRVGIGTANPATKLFCSTCTIQVDGSNATSIKTNGLIRTVNSSGAGLQVSYDDAATADYTFARGLQNLRVYGTQGGTFTNTAFEMPVGIGYSADRNAAPASTLDVFGSAQFGNTVNVSSFTAAGQAILRGTATNDSAAAGYIGEYLSNNLGGAQTPPGSTAYVAIATVTFTAGDWDVSAVADMAAGATTAATQLGCAISTSNTSRSSTSGGNICEIAATLAVSKETTCNIPVARLSLASSTAYYLVCQITYTTLGGATYTTDSILHGRRVR